MSIIVVDGYGILVKQQKISSIVNSIKEQGFDVKEIEVEAE